jgi:hypothetical protein
MVFPALTGVGLVMALEFCIVKLVSTIILGEEGPLLVPSSILTKKVSTCLKMMYRKATAKRRRRNTRSRRLDSAALCTCAQKLQVETIRPRWGHCTTWQITNAYSTTYSLTSSIYRPHRAGSHLKIANGAIEALAVIKVPNEGLTAEIVPKEGLTAALEL